MNCVFCSRKCEPGVSTKHGQACDDYCASKSLCGFCKKVVLDHFEVPDGLFGKKVLNGVQNGRFCSELCASKSICVFCNKEVLDNVEVPDGLFGKRILNGVQTNYGRACSDYCAAGGLVVEAMKCEAKEAPCIGHDNRLCAAVGELKRGVLASPNLEVLKKGIRIHVKRCVSPACTMPHTMAAVYGKKAPQPLYVPPLKRKLEIDDLAHVLRVYRAKYVPLSHQRAFTEDLKSIMCREGCAELQPVLDTYAVQEAPCVKPAPYQEAPYAEV